MHTMRTADFKAAVLGAGDGDLKDGEILAKVAVFNNVDSYGDVVIPGAFTEDLARIEASGDPLPFIWAHDWSDPFSHVGTVLAAEETDDALLVRAYISPEEREANPKAAQVYRLLKARRVTQFSFAFDVEDGGWGERDGQEVYELRRLKLHEVGPCLLGVNQETELLVAKAERLAAHATEEPPSRKALAKISAARDALEAVLATAGKSSPPNAEEPATAPPGRPDPETSRAGSKGYASPGLSPASVTALIPFLGEV